MLKSNVLHKPESHFLNYEHQINSCSPPRCDHYEQGRSCWYFSKTTSLQNRGCASPRPIHSFLDRATFRDGTEQTCCSAKDQASIHLPTTQAWRINSYKRQQSLTKNMFWVSQKFLHWKGSTAGAVSTTSGTVTELQWDKDWWITWGEWESLLHAVHVLCWALSLRSYSIHYSRLPQLQPQLTQLPFKSVTIFYLLCLQLCPNLFWGFLYFRATFYFYL